MPAAVTFQYDTGELPAVIAAAANETCYGKGDPLLTIR